MNNIKKHKRLIAAIVVILLAVLVEIFANWSAWGHAAAYFVVVCCITRYMY